MANRQPDWVKTGTIGAYAEWLRSKSDAICVVVIRPQDSVLALDPRCAPVDAQRLIEDYAPRLAAGVEQARREKKPAARLELGPNVE